MARAKGRGPACGRASNCRNEENVKKCHKSDIRDSCDLEEKGEGREKKRRVGEREGRRRVSRSFEGAKVVGWAGRRTKLSWGRGAPRAPLYHADAQLRASARALVGSISNLACV